MISIIETISFLKVTTSNVSMEAKIKYLYYIDNFTKPSMFNT